MSNARTSARSARAGCRLALALALAVGLASACTPRQDRRGYLLEDALISKVQPGVHDQDSVASLLGSPTSIGTFEQEVWYYITSHSEQLAFFEPKVLDQQVVAVRFNDAGIVQTVKRYTLEDGKIINPVDRKTLTRGRELGFLEQIFGNIGRFNDSE